MKRLLFPIAALAIAAVFPPTAAAQAGNDVVVSYILGSGGNQVLLPENGSIQFPETNVGSSSPLNLIVTNRSTRQITLNNAIMEGATFRLTGLPLLPLQIPAERELRITINFVPAQRVRTLGTLRLEFSGFVKVIALEGTGSAPVLVYTYTIGSTTQPAQPGESIRLGETPINVPIEVRFRVTNQGNTEARITNITMGGTGYQLLDLPPLPSALSPGGSADFVVKFTTGEAGAFGGRLRVDGALFDMAATGTGPKFSFSAITQIGVTPLLPTTAFTFPSISIGTESKALFRIENTGNALGIISGVAVFGGNFSAEDLPMFPVRLQPGDVMEFNVVFAPQTPGLQTANVEIDSFRFAIRGTGSPPPNVPATIFSFTADASLPMQQPAVGLKIESPYPFLIKGRLTLSFASESFGDDQTVQFATGGRTIDFTIPAGTTDALFGDTANSTIQFQTGSVAGNISVIASYQVAAVNVTPAVAPSRSFSIQSLEPRIRNIRIGQRTATSFELIVTGYSTPRTVTEMTFSFQSTSGTSTTLSTNVESPFSSWYQNASSKAYGSQFTSSVQIVGTADISSIQSVTVTASNQRGSSTPVTVSLR